MINNECFCAVERPKAYGTSVNIFNNKCFMGKHTPNSSNCMRDEFIVYKSMHSNQN